MGLTGLVPGLGDEDLCSRHGARSGVARVRELGDDRAGGEAVEES